MEASRCWNCNAITNKGTICDECKIASDFTENYFEDGELCHECRWCHVEPDTNFSECSVTDPFDCPALPQ